MKHLTSVCLLKRVVYWGSALMVMGVLVGCDEVNMAVDSLLGTKSPALSAASSQPAAVDVVPVKKRDPGQRPVPGPEAGAAPKNGAQPAAVAPAAPPPPAPPKIAGQPWELDGKRRAPGALSPTAAAAEETKPREIFVMGRDPFEAPTEILPSECPPSMPLCRFDRSQLKLVGVIQVSDGQYKGMVEDPDGRGYFVTTGMQIGGGTVTQVTSRGIILHLHRTRQDVQLPLFSEARQTGDSF